jgi:hypothetical protein
MLNPTEYTESDNKTVRLTPATLAVLKPIIKADARRDYIGFIDPLTGELDTTALSEWIAASHDLYAQNTTASIPDDVFDLVSDIETQLIKAGKVSDPINPK